MKPTRSLRARLTLLFTLITTGLLALLAVGAIAYSAHSANRNAERVLAIAERRVRSELSEEGGLKKADELVREENELLERVDGAMFIVDGRGNLIARSRRRVPRWPRMGDDGWRVAAVTTPGATVVIGIPWWKTRDALQGQALLLLGGLAWAAAITSAGAWILVGRTLRPIGVLARQAHAASTEDLRVRLKAPSDDAEGTDLVATFNQLLERLTQSAAARGRFYAAASHELRTPLQALSGHLELALTQKRSSEEYRSLVTEAYGQTRRLTRLVQELLLLNQLHQRTSRPPTEAVDLVDAAERLMLQLDGAFAAQRLKVSRDVPDTAEIEAPTAHVEIILRNLLENAAKYAAPATTVSLRVARDNAAWVFEVSNECSAPLDVPPGQLFEPFVRAGASRTSRTGGNGLGLAISKAVADANGWSLDWREAAGGVRASVTFPPAELRGAGSSKTEGELCLTGSARLR